MLRGDLRAEDALSEEEEEANEWKGVALLCSKVGLKSRSVSYKFCWLNTMVLRISIKGVPLTSTSFRHSKKSDVDCGECNEAEGEVKGLELEGDG